MTGLAPFFFSFVAESLRGFVIFVIAVDAVAIVVCVLKGRFFSALFGVGAIGIAIWALSRSQILCPPACPKATPYGAVVWLYGSVPLSLIVIIRAIRQAKTGTYWVVKLEDLRKTKVDKLVAKAGNNLEGDEQVLIAVDGTRFTSGARHSISTQAGVLIATDQRLLFYAKKGTESFPYETISSFEHDTTENGDDKLVFHSSGNIVMISWIHAKNLDEFVATVKSRMDGA